MKKALVRRVVSLFLCFCMVIGFVPIIDAQAAEIKGGTFDPHTGYLELEFGYQLTQYVNINVYVRSPSDDGLKKEFVGSIVENYLLSGANDVFKNLENADRVIRGSWNYALHTGNQKGRRFGQTVRGWHLSSRQELCR